jgi:hypothetical protein
VFEQSVAQCIEEGLVSGQRFAVDASLIEADANRQNSSPQADWDKANITPEEAPRAVREYLETLDDAAFGAATPGKELKKFHRTYKTPRSGVDRHGIMRYRARKTDCDTCELKARCGPTQPQRKVTRSIHEPSRDVARAIAQTNQYAISRKLRKKVEMLFAHLKRILGLGRIRLRGPCGARDEFHLAATAQNFRKLAKLIPAQNLSRKA